jgi:hypothetical protein
MAANLAKCPLASSIQIPRNVRAVLPIHQREPVRFLSLRDRCIEIRRGTVFRASSRRALSPATTAETNGVAWRWSSVPFTKPGSARLTVTSSGDTWPASLQTNMRPRCFGVL